MGCKSPYFLNYEPKKKLFMSSPFAHKTHQYQKINFLIFWDSKASTLVVTKMHFFWPKVIDMIFYDFFKNFWVARAGDIAIQTAKIANIDDALGNKNLAQKARFF